MNRRDSQIAAIKERTGELRKARLEECYEHVLLGYQSESIVGKIGQVVIINDRTPSDFRVLTLSEVRPIEHFNDDSYFWDLYCEQLGRAIALSERSYIFETLQGLPPEGKAISAADPSFESIVEAVRVLLQRGHRPDSLCAPIDLMPPFASDKRHSIDWNDKDGEFLLVPGGPRLKLYWSSRSSPLDGFVVLDSSAIRWSVKPDPSTQERLTIAIGETVTTAGQHGVMFLAETVAKVDVEPSRALLVPLAGKPLDPEEYVDRETMQEMNHG